LSRGKGENDIRKKIANLQAAHYFQRTVEQQLDVRRKQDLAINLSFTPQLGCCGFCATSSPSSDKLPADCTFVKHDLNKIKIITNFSR